MNINRKKTVGFYFALAAAVLSLAGAFVYRGVTYKSTAVYAVLIIAAVLEVLIVVLSAVKELRTEYNIAAMISSVLMMTGAALSIRPMVREIANTIAGLNEWSVLYTYFLYIALTLLGGLLFLIASFTGIVSEKK